MNAEILKIIYRNQVATYRIGENNVKRIVVSGLLVAIEFDNEDTQFFTVDRYLAKLSPIRIVE